MSKQLVSYIKLTLYDDGSMSIEGNIGDPKVALGMIDSAREAVGRQLVAQQEPAIVMPNHLVAVPR